MISSINNSVNNKVKSRVKNNRKSLNFGNQGYYLKTFEMAEGFKRLNNGKELPHDYINDVQIHLDHKTATPLLNSLIEFLDKGKIKRLYDCKCKEANDQIEMFSFAYDDIRTFKLDDDILLLGSEPTEVKGDPVLHIYHDGDKRSGHTVLAQDISPWTDNIAFDTLHDKLKKLF